MLFQPKFVVTGVTTNNDQGVIFFLTTANTGFCTHFLVFPVSGLFGLYIQNLKSN